MIKLGRFSRQRTKNRNASCGIVRLGVTAALVLGISLVALGSFGGIATATSAPTYGGRAFGASINGTLVADTGPLAATGTALNGYAGLVNLKGPGYSFKAPTVPGL